MDIKIIEQQKKIHEANHNTAVKEWERLRIVIIRLEGAISVCNELLKLEENNDQHNNTES
jgi:plasmid rolling circle replication initiator protein Rep